MAFVVALLVTVVAVPLVLRLSSALGLVDTPGSDPLKIHQRPIPRSGGLAVALGLATGVLVGGAASAPLLVGGGVALGLGLADDRWGLSPKLRFLLEMALALAVSYLLVGTGSWLRVGLGALAILVAINASNLFDGLDGLLSGAGALTALAIALLATGTLRESMWALSGALVGFLLYNRPPARIFLGDGGSYFVGGLLGIGLVELSSSASLFLGGTVTFGMIGVDFLLTLLRRWRSRRPLFVGDRSHLYDQLIDRGWSSWAVLLGVVGLHGVLAGAGVVIAQLEAPWAAAMSVTTILALLVLAWRLKFVARASG